MKKREVGEYVSSLLASEKFGQMVVAHKVFPAQDASFGTDETSLDPRLIRVCGQQGIKRFYTHQQKAFKELDSGKNILVATPTSSGKSMVYNMPVLDMILKEPASHALYLFPLKALSQDQLKKLVALEQIFADVPLIKNTGLAAIYDGDTTPYARRKIREHTPPILLTNPEMLHLALLPFHENWAHFFARLRYIVIDEVHSYRGILGSHFSWVLKRLKRICNRYGSAPRFILSSATIGNPEQFGRAITGEDIQVINESGGPQSKKHFLLINPHDSAAYCASQFLEAAMKRGLRTIVYTQSRKMTELISLWTRPRLGDLAESLSSYRAGFLPEQRRDIEKKLGNGELLGVISTSALELGIDIGDLDICILVGYPGSIMSSMQRGGRVGRAGRESAVMLVASEDALDQFYMKNPQRFFAGKVESAIINPANTTVMRDHLHCAAAEIPLSQQELIALGDTVSERVNEMCQEATLLQSADGQRYYATRKRPQRQVSLRGGGSSCAIIDAASGEIMGEIDTARALKECHEGAVYLHGVKEWFVERLDLLAHEVIVSAKNVKFYTRALSNKNTEILKILHRGTVFGCRIFFGEVRVTEKVTGYQKKNSGSGRIIQTIPLDLPPQTMETTGLWLEIPETLVAGLEEKKLHFMGGLHALEHLLISVFPLLILCDRNDIGGISCPYHEQTSGATIFIYDGHPGGSGLAQEAYARAEDLLLTARSILLSCTCENGCPGCVHSPKCGSGNRPIDKNSCREMLAAVTGAKLPASADESELVFEETCIDGAAETQPRILETVLPVRWGVFDLETKFSAQEVGGWHNADKMGVSVGVVYNAADATFHTFYEDQEEKLVAYLLGLDLVVGFNNKRFDNKVLWPFGGHQLSKIPTIDLLEEIKNYLGYRLSLDRVASQTLDVKKSGDGLQALQWYKEGEIEQIATYCRDDVALTRDLFLFALQEGYLLFQNKAKKTVRLPLRLDKTLRKVMSYREKIGKDEYFRDPRLGAVTEDP